MSHPPDDPLLAHPHTVALFTDSLTRIGVSDPDIREGITRAAMAAFVQIEQDRQLPTPQLIRAHADTLWTPQAGTAAEKERELEAHCKQIETTPLSRLDLSSPRYHTDRSAVEIPLREPLGPGELSCITLGFRAASGPEMRGGRVIDALLKRQGELPDDDRTTTVAEAIADAIRDTAKDPASHSHIIAAQSACTMLLSEAPPDIVHAAKSIVADFPRNLTLEALRTTIADCMVATNGDTKVIDSLKELQRKTYTEKTIFASLEGVTQGFRSLESRIVKATTPPPQPSSSLLRVFKPAAASPPTPPLQAHLLTIVHDGLTTPPEAPREHVRPPGSRA